DVFLLFALMSREKLAIRNGLGWDGRLECVSLGGIQAPQFDIRQKLAHSFLSSSCVSELVTASTRSVSNGPLDPSPGKNACQTIYTSCPPWRQTPSPTPSSVLTQMQLLPIAFRIMQSLSWEKLLAC